MNKHSVYINFNNIKNDNTLILDYDIIYNKLYKNDVYKLKPNNLIIFVYILNKLKKNINKKDIYINIKNQYDLFYSIIKEIKLFNNKINIYIDDSLMLDSEFLILLETCKYIK